MTVDISPRIRLALAALSFSLFVISCADDRVSPGAELAAASAAEPTAQIQWFEGTVEEALDFAKRERRPVFLYWGAEWCPPCHALRTKLFTQPEFVGRLAATVPVYLDGDTAEAQIWGEKLATYGYPTVIVLDSDGNELTRVQGTLPVDEYGETISRAIESSRPITEIVAAVEEGGAAAVAPAELSILAFYSFGQDQALDLDLERERALFRRLREETPAEMPVERARFLTLELFALADESEDISVAELTADQRASLTSEVEAVLADRNLRNTNLDLLLYGSTEVVELLAPEPGEARDALVAALTDAARLVQEDESLSTSDRLASLYPRLGLARLGQPEPPEGETARVPEAVQQEVREGVRWAGEAVQDEDEMQAVMNTMAGLLEDAGLEDEASRLLSEKMSETTAPYYYMGWLAGLEAEAGNAEEAVDLYRQAWLSAREATSSSSMSAFRWGSSYLRQTMKYAPDEVDAISADGESILGDLLAGPDAFAGGNWSRLKSLDNAMESWTEESPGVREPVAASLLAKVGAACGDFPSEGPESAGERCRSMVSEAGA